MEPLSQSKHKHIAGLLSNTDHPQFSQEQIQDWEDVDSAYLAEESSGSTLAPPIPLISTTSSDALPTRLHQSASALTETQEPPAQGRGIDQVAPLSYTGANDDGDSNSSTGVGQRAVKRKLERRGHTKSRRGCFNCKRRRVKCQETRPSCGHCLKHGLRCEYPSLPPVVHQPQHQLPIFSLQDMRLFHQFLFYCYPHHPIGAENLWTHEIPCLAHNYDYLMHAILGYAASELMSRHKEDQSLLSAALEHRIKAIRAIKKALAGAEKNKSSTATCNDASTLWEEGNALMATCFVLTYQSVLLPDGLTEYMTFCRGIVVIAYIVYMHSCHMPSLKPLLFAKHLAPDWRQAVLEPHMRALPLINQEWADQAVGAIRALEPLLVVDETGEVERCFWEKLLGIAEALKVSCWDAYLALTSHYGWWMTLKEHARFQRLINPSNHVAMLIAAHWVALEHVMDPIADVERTKGAAKLPPHQQSQPESTEDGDENRRRGSDGSGSRANRLWLKYLNAQIRLEAPYLRSYNHFPEWVQENLDIDKRYFGRMVW